MKKIISTYVVENDALIFEENENFFTKKRTIKVYLQKNLFTKTVTKDGDLTKTVVKDNPNPPKKEFLYEIRGKRPNVIDINNFVKLIKSDFDKNCKCYNYSSVLDY